MIYTVKFYDAVYVLHLFQKKSRAMARKDLDLGKSRYREVLPMRKKL